MYCEHFQPGFWHLRTAESKDQGGEQGGATWVCGGTDVEASGLCCGLSSLVKLNDFLFILKAAGLAIGICGDAGVRANAH